MNVSNSMIRSGENVTKLKPRIGWHKVYKWYTRLAAFQKDRLEQMRFGKFFSIIPFNLNGGLIDASTERWRGETNSFIFGCAEMVLGLEDMVRLMGLPVDGMAMFLERSSNYRSVVKDSLGQVPRSTYNIKKSSLRLAWLSDTFGVGIDPQRIMRETESAFQARVEEIRARQSVQEEGSVAADYELRAFLLYFFGLLLFSKSAGGWVSCSYLDYIQDLQSPVQYAWGAAALAHLYSQLTARVHGCQGSIGGLLPLIQIWLWEHIDVGRPIRIDTYDKAYPQAKRWQDFKYGKGSRRSRDCYRVLFNMLRPEQIIWRPYESQEENPDPYVVAGQDRFDRDVWLVCGLTTGMHYISRAPLQINLPIGIPTPPYLDRSHLLSGFKRGTSLTSIARKAMMNWQSYGDYAFKRSKVCTNEEYSDWYARNMMGCFLSKPLLGQSNFMIGLQAELAVMRAQFAEGEVRIGEKVGSSGEIPEIKAGRGDTSEVGLSSKIPGVTWAIPSSEAPVAADFIELNHLRKNEARLKAEVINLTLLAQEKEVKWINEEQRLRKELEDAKSEAQTLQSKNERLVSKVRSLIDERGQVPLKIGENTTPTNQALDVTTKIVEDLTVELAVVRGELDKAKAELNAACAECEYWKNLQKDGEEIVAQARDSLTQLELTKNDLIATHADLSKVKTDHAAMAFKAKLAALVAEKVETENRKIEREAKADQAMFEGRISSLTAKLEELKKVESAEVRDLRADLAFQKKLAERDIEFAVKLVKAEASADLRVAQARVADLEARLAAETVKVQQTISSFRRPGALMVTDMSAGIDQRVMQHQQLLGKVKETELAHLITIKHLENDGIIPAEPSGGVEWIAIGDEEDDACAAFRPESSGARLEGMAESVDSPESSSKRRRLE